MYQGLFYLSAGCLAFVSMLFIFRLIGEKRNSYSTTSDDTFDKWTKVEPLTIVDIINETHDIKTFRLQRKNKNFSNYLPGQFLSFVIGNPEDKVARSYSLSCGDENTQTISVSIKLLDGGVGSTWFHSRSIGDKVFAYPPSGHFTNIDDEFENQVFVCGGIGITPFISMIEAQISKASSKKISLFYGMKTTKDMAFHEQLTLWAKRYNNFSYFPILSNVDEKESWDGDKGYITVDLIKQKISTKLIDNTYYFCGPPILTDSVMDALETVGVSDVQMFSEKFASPVSFDLSLVKARGAHVEYLGQSLEYSGKKTFLEFLEDKGLPAKFACRVGVCGACKVKCDSKVEQFTDAGLTRSDKKNGYILSCVARPVEGSTVKLS